MTTMNGRSAAGLLLLLALALTGCAREDDGVRTVASSEPAVTVAARALCEAYQANEVAADTQYRDKVIVVTGTVEAVKKDLSGHPLVLLDGPGAMRVRCMYAKDHVAPTAGYAKGQEIRVKGLCKGKLVTVNLNYCQPLP